MLDRALDIFLLVTIVGAPWVALLLALAPFRELLRRDWRWFLLVAVGLWFFVTQLISPLTETFAQSIIHVTTKPFFAAYTSAILEHARAPLWLPQLGAGLPALANPYVAYMSPFTSILLLFRDLDQGVNVLMVIHLVFAGLSTILLCRSLGLSKIASLFAALAFVWNPWVFGKLGTGIHALYIFAYTWIPLTWALLLHFLRTRKPADAARTGIPLAFMALSMPTVFAQMLFATLFVAVAGTLPVFRKHWRKALIGLACALVLIPLGAFLIAAPEHLAARELLPVNVNNRFGIVRMGGWRDLDLSTRDFLRALLPNEIGQLFGPRGYAGAFGVPFSPGDAVVVITFLGLIVACTHPTLRARSHPFAHTALFLIVASITTHGLFYEPMMRGYALWAASGNLPVVGALLLIAMMPFAGIGMEYILFALRTFGRHVALVLQNRFRFGSDQEQVRRLLAQTVTGALSAFLVLFLTAELLWGTHQVVNVLRGTESDHRLDLRFTIPRIALSDLRNVPHLKALGEIVKDSALPARIYCTGDIATWPSPCFEFLVDRYNLELVGIGELAWSMPKWQWRPFLELTGTWKGPFSTLFTRVLQLASTEYVVSSRPLDLPLVKEVLWDAPPGNSELWGDLLKSAIGGGPWPEAWDQRMRIQEVPDAFPRAFFADPIRVAGTFVDQQQEVQTLLSRPDVHPRTVAFLHTDSWNAHALANLSVPVLSSPLNAAESREKLLAPYTTRGETGWSKVKINTTSPYPSAWIAEGRFPHDGVLVFTQMYYPGFRATVNGQAAPVARADLFVTAVPVPAGESVVRLEYVPYAILLSSVLPLGFLLLLWWRTRRVSAGAYD